MVWNSTGLRAVDTSIPVIQLALLHYAGFNCTHSLEFHVHVSVRKSTEKGFFDVDFATYYVTWPL